MIIWTNYIIGLKTEAYKTWQLVVQKDKKKMIIDKHSYSVLHKEKTKLFQFEFELSLYEWYDPNDKHLLGLSLFDTQWQLD